MTSRVPAAVDPLVSPVRVGRPAEDGIFAFWVNLDELVWRGGPRGAGR